MNLPEEAKKYAPVLERMVELLGSNENMKFGDAMTQASAELGLTVPKNLEGAMLHFGVRDHREQKNPRSRGGLSH